MATKKLQAKAPVEVVETNLSMASLPKDFETKSEVGPKLVTVRELQAFLSASLTAHIQNAWGVAFTAIQTGTDKTTSEIYLYKADPLDEGAVQVNRSGNQNAANFSLIVPLQKLNQRPNHGYQWEIIPKEMQVADGPPVFVIDIKNRKSVPRNLQAEAAEAATGETAKSASTKGGAALTPEQEERAKALREQISSHEEALSKLYAELEGLG